MGMLPSQFKSGEHGHFTCETLLLLFLCFMRATFFFWISTIYFLKSRASIFLFVNHVLIHFICLFLCVSLALIRSFVFKKGKENVGKVITSLSLSWAK